jgi:hypothetical protein
MGLSVPRGLWRSCFCQWYQSSSTPLNEPEILDHTKIYTFLYVCLFRVQLHVTQTRSKYQLRQIACNR